MTKRVALICGVGGQDGSYLARLLLSKNYIVFGTSRNPSVTMPNLVKLGIEQDVKRVSLDTEDYANVLAVVNQAMPDEIYYLAGETSVAASFKEPSRALQSIAIGVLNILEACRQSTKSIRLFSAGSSECFGNTNGAAATELTPFAPLSPYAIGKTAAFWLVNQYRQSYGVFACTGILFNHESPLRPDHFVTQKIIRAVQEIAAGRQQELKLGRLDVARDWGWAPEYVEAMWLMLQQTVPQDYVISTGKTITLEDFVAAAFAHVNLDWRQYVVSDSTYMRPVDIAVSCADSSKIQTSLGWRPKISGTKVVENMFHSIH
jgi:GDPmannose 4,6-dehydratase